MVIEHWINNTPACKSVTTKNTAVRLVRKIELFPSGKQVEFEGFIHIYIYISHELSPMPTANQLVYVYVAVSHKPGSPITLVG